MSGSATKLLPLRIRLPYTTEEEFIDKYGSNLGRGGVFVATRALKPEGTGLAFEFVLADGARVLRGEGVVMKAQVDAGGGRSGMTVRFVKLDAASKALLDRVVAKRSGPDAQPAPPPGLVRKVRPPPQPRPSPLPPGEGRGEGSEPPAAHRPFPPTEDTGPSAPIEPAESLRSPETEPPSPEAGDTDFDVDLNAPEDTPAEHQASRAEPAVTAQATGAPPAPTSTVTAEPPVPMVTTGAPPTPTVTTGAPPAPTSTVTAELPASTEATGAPPTVTTEAPPTPVTAEPPASVMAPEAGPGPAPTATVEPSPLPRPRAAPDEAPSLAPPPTEESPAARTDLPAPPDMDSATSRNRRRALLEVPVTAPTPAPSGPEVVLGIDLGTSHASVAVFHEGVAALVPLPGSEETRLPALVAVDSNGDLLVGPAALVESARAPRRAAPGLKRLLGLRARSPHLRWLAPQLPFDVAADARGDAGVELGGRIVAPTLFAAMLLRELRHAATTFVGRKVTRAVLCAPTHFTERQRAALREAATMAGLEVPRVLTSSAAAALAYGHGRGLARKRVLVVDLGGGGLEVCVVQVTGDDVEVITTGGDATLGGMDFDARIAEALASDLADQGIPRPEHPLDWGPLRATAEATKVALSERDQVDVPVPTGSVPPLNRERVEALTADLAQRVVAVTREVLESNALSPQGLDAVLLVGGQARAPLVRRRLEESLGVPVRDDLDPRGVVARGAALLGQALLLAEAGKPAASISEVLTAPIGVAERGGGFRRVLERNTRLPAGKTLVLPVTPGPLELALFQGLSPLSSENEYLGRLSLPVERPGDVELHFTLSADGTLSLDATLPGAKRQPVTLVTEDLDDAERDALLARSPLASDPEPRPAGLLSGLKKLFGRR